MDAFQFLFIVMHMEFFFMTGSCFDRDAYSNFIHATEYDEVHLLCNATVRPPLWWKYLRNDQDPPSYIYMGGSDVVPKYRSRFKVDSETYRLTIHNVTVNDSGLYSYVDRDGFGHAHGTLLTVGERNDSLSSENTASNPDSELKRSVIVVNVMLGGVTIVIIIITVYSGVSQNLSTAPTASQGGESIQKDDESIRVDPQLQNTQDGARRDTNVKSGPTLCQDMLAGVFNELHSRPARDRDVVITGLSAVGDIPDELLVAELFHSELLLNLTIVQCRRIGKQRPSVPKPRPLLVTFCTASDAQTVLLQARRLRDSQDAHTRSNIFINPNLTKAEAELAYRERCRRREQRARKVTVCNGNVPPPNASVISETERSPSHSSQEVNSGFQSGRHADNGLPAPSIQGNKLVVTADVHRVDDVGQSDPDLSFQ